MTVHACFPQQSFLKILSDSTLGEMVIDTRSEKRDIKKKQKNVLRQIVLYAENINRSDIVLEILLLSHSS